ncbi:MAG: O-antigen ligase family protein [Lachnospiraceae bacterium]|nr:O-antigen ligase family protein [Lachnospiraceae bacterium]
MLKKNSWKRILYLICFVGINLIEFTKATQTGDVWYVTVNLTGLAVFLMIASTFSRHEIWNLRNLIISLLGFGLMVGAYFFKQTSEIYIHLGQVESALLNVWWLAIAAGVLIRRIWVEHTKKLYFSSLGVLWVFLMLLMTVSVNKRLWPLWFLLMFGAFYLTDFTEEEGRMLLDAMIDGTILCFFGFQIYAYATRPYDVVRYVGFYDNANTVALYYLMVYGMVLCKLHLLHVRKAAWWWKLIFFIGAGGMLSFQIFTLCRTAWVVSVLLTIVYGIVVVRKLWGDKWGKVLLRGGALGLMVLVTFLPVYYTIRWLPTLTHYRVWYADEYSVDKVHSFDPPDSWKYIELDEFLDAFLGRIIHTLKSVDASNPLVLRVHAGEEEVELVEVPWTQDESTRIRLTIYKTYLQEMKWFGNAPDKGYYRIGENAVSWHAQNLWIQVGYSYGMVAGIVMILLTAAVFVCQRKRLRAQRENPYAIIPLMVCVMFFGFGLTEVVWLPGQLILFMMFFVQHPSFVCDKSDV